MRIQAILDRIWISLLENPDPDPTPQKLDPVPVFCKMLLQLFVARNFC
jgi:hypothetical protein